MGRWIVGIGLVAMAMAAQTADAQTTLVSHGGVVLRDGPSDTAKVVANLPANTVALVRKGVPEPDDKWLEVETATPQAVLNRGWLRVQDLRMSPGVVSSWWGRPDTETLLRQEIAAASDRDTTMWLSMSLARFYLRRDRSSDALALFEAVGQERPANHRTPFAYLWAARIYRERGDLTATRMTYEALLGAAPGFVATPATCAASGVATEDRLCSGEERIAVRLAALRALETRVAATDRVVNSSDSTPEQKAQAWISLGEEWSKKNAIDPGDRADAVRCYEAAAAAAPGTNVGGDARWRLIALSAPYEWEGDIRGLIAWTDQQYGKFLRDYPQHRQAGEALFQVARAAWAKAGWTVAFDNLFDPGGWSVIRKTSLDLETWFDTRGFGGGVGESPRIDIDQTRRALALFKDVALKYPTSAAAPQAQYNVAVILDYCLHDTPNAIPAFEAYLKMPGATAPFVAKATARLAALKKNKGS